eukprot:SAG11_NODE_2353_length_3476_cov_2.774060_4_plen_135_part_00
MEKTLSASQDKQPRSDDSGLVTVPGSSSKVPQSVVARGAIGTQGALRRLTADQFNQSISVDADGKLDGKAFVKPMILQVYNHMLNLDPTAIKYGERDKLVDTTNSSNPAQSVSTENRSSPLTSLTAMHITPTEF